MLDTYSKIGSSFSNQALTGISPTISSSCGAEPFISELYEAISGKECKRESLVDKLRVLNKREPFNGIFDEFIALYNQRGREGPGSVRGFASHVRGDTLTYSQNSLKETWTSLYSLGLVKTATSVLLGDQTQFYEFDKFARKNGLIHSANLAYVPLANTHHNPVGFLPLISSE